MEELDGVLETTNKLKEQLKDMIKTLDGMSTYLLSIQNLEFPVASSPIRKQLKEFEDVISAKKSWTKEEINTVLFETLTSPDKTRQQKFIKLEK